MNHVLPEPQTQKKNTSCTLVENTSRSFFGGASWKRVGHPRTSGQATSRATGRMVTFCGIPLPEKTWGWGHPGGEWKREEEEKTTTTPSSFPTDDDKLESEHPEEGRKRWWRCLPIIWESRSGQINEDVWLRTVVLGRGERRGHTRSLTYYKDSQLYLSLSGFSRPFVFLLSFHVSTSFTSSGTRKPSQYISLMTWQGSNFLPLTKQFLVWSLSRRSHNWVTTEFCPTRNKTESGYVGKSHEKIITNLYFFMC